MNRTLFAAVLFVVAAPAFAQSSTPRVDQRQANQERRIDQGIESGRLTEREAARVDRQQDRVDAMENRAKSDGVVTKAERARLHRAQDHASGNIYRQKHDRQHDYNHNDKVDRPRGR